MLQQEGYPVEKVTLLSTGRSYTTTVADDTADLQARYSTDSSPKVKKAVMVLHLYAAIPGSDSGRGMSRKDVALQGNKGGVIALVFIAAFLLSAGQSVDSFLGGVEKLLIFDGEKASMPDPVQKFYNDLDAETTAKCLVELVPYQSKATLFTPETYEEHRDVPATYLLCKNDLAIPFDLQKAMVATAGEHLVKSHICGTGHSPMLGAQQVVVGVIENPVRDATIIRPLA